ncbi:hypothetical protein KAR91_53600 [Candidatus Pacearchaeota archaeon]|nr:hypothetical protein [Candidatus Pacearchaeota archaeon]
MTQVQFIKALDELGLSVCNTIEGLTVHNRNFSWTGEWHYKLADLTYQNRIDIIRECKREMG